LRSALRGTGGVACRRLGAAHVTNFIPLRPEASSMIGYGQEIAAFEARQLREMPWLTDRV